MRMVSLAYSLLMSNTVEPKPATAKYPNPQNRLQKTVSQVTRIIMTYLKTHEFVWSGYAVQTVMLTRIEA